MIILGLILALVGWLMHVQLLLYLGIILVVVGAVLNFVPLGGGARRRVY